MMNMWHKLVFPFCLSLLISSQTQAKTISPNQYGFNKAKTGEERYAILYKTHCEAVRIGADVDYSGFRNIELTIPANAKSIPLTENNDFSGVTFTVTNTSHDIFLFQKTAPLKPVKVTKCMIRRGFYPSVRKETHGRVLLVIEDKTPWVEKRKGYNYSAIRKDAIVVKNGRAANKPIYHYKSEQSSPMAYYRILDDEGVSFANLTFSRSDKSTHKTYLLEICNDDNILIENVEVNTPESKLTADAAFRIKNSTNIVFKRVRINNTYSGQNSYGYGINLENVTNVTFDQFYGNGKWGVFGNNNVNSAAFTNSKMNRFDIHCYGRDVTFTNCEFFDLYNQFSSFYGKLVFNSCIFTDFVPVSLEASYNAYTGFDVYFNHCVINTTSSNHKLISAGRIDENGDKREELSALCWPNVYIKDMTVNAGYAANPLYIFTCRGETQKRNIDYMSKVSIDGLTYNATDTVSHIRSISFCNFRGLTTTNVLNIAISNVKLMGVTNKQMPTPSSPDDKFVINVRQEKGKSNDVRVKQSEMRIVEQ